MPNPVVCPECGEAVTAGRLACSSCGTLLASVVRVQGPTTRGPVAEQRAQGAVSSRPDPPSVLSDEGESGIDESVDEAGETPVGTGSPAEATPAASSPGAGVSAEAPARPRQPSPINAILRDTSVDDEVGLDDAPVRYLGGYVTPATMVASPSMTGAPSPAVSETAPAVPARAAAATPAARRLPVARPDVRAGWLTILGAVLCLVAFLLPWPGQGDLVIGTSGGAGWFDRWGLAATPNLVLVLAELAVLAFAVLTIGVPAWIRFGALPLVVGGLLLGVTWIYLTRPFGADIGILLLGLGAGLQVAGGAWALRRTEVRSPV